MLHAYFTDLYHWYSGALASGGYPLVAALMAMESSIIPLPSEIVIPPAAHYAKTTGQMSLIGIVLAGAIGSWVGATAMYWAARLAGRPLVLAYGKYVLISAEKVRGAERWATRFGAVGIFVSRLLPVVRHLIGIPAGIVRLNYATFSLFTLIGSALWCAVLCWLGVTMGSDPEILHGSVRRWGMWLGGLVLGLYAIYWFGVKRFMSASATADESRAVDRSDRGGARRETTARPRPKSKGRRR